MRSDHDEEKWLLQYLLGKLSEEQQVAIEDRAFADADYLARLESMEADLIDAYVRGDLSQAERVGFENRFLTSPQRRSKVEFAKAFARVEAESKAAEANVTERMSSWKALVGMLQGWNPVFQVAASLAAVIIVAGISWLLIDNAAMHSRVAALETQRNEWRNREDVLRQQLATEARKKPAPAPGVLPVPAMASLVFLPSLSRAESTREQLILNPSMELARIEIQLEARDEFPRYRAELTRRGQDILVLGNLSKHRSGGGHTVSFDVPASALAAGDYELALKGVSGGPRPVDIGYYYFSVQKR